MKKPELVAAQKILFAVIKKKISYKKLFTQETSSLTKEICFGVCRNFYYLAEIANHFLKKMPKDLNLWVTILIGIYQLRFLNTPPHAAVKETVEILEKPFEKNFVNAVLRSYLRTQEAAKQSSIPLDSNNNPKCSTNSSTTNLEAIYNHPQWLITKIRKSWPKDWEQILFANNQHPPLTIRVNTKKITREKYLALLKTANIPAKISDSAPAGLIITTPLQVTNLPGFADGLLSIQDLAAQLAVQFLDSTPGLRVLDACAAPGGKTCHILETATDLKQCLAIDISKTRAKKIYANLERLGLSADVKVADCLELEKWWDGELFDRILLDAPCSATGVIRRNPDIKLLRTAEEVAIVIELQKKLLDKLWTILKPGGKLVYTTCSILPEENSKQIANFLKNHPDCKCLEINLSQASIHSKSQYGLQILPGENDMDGFFYSVLIRVS